jgi:hypothetical protein
MMLRLQLSHEYFSTNVLELGMATAYAVSCATRNDANKENEKSIVLKNVRDEIAGGIIAKIKF